MAVRPTLELGAQDAQALLFGLMLVNMQQMSRAGPNRPSVIKLIHQRKLKYSRVDPLEEWQTYDQMLAGVAKKGFEFADCEDLATVAAAEMRLGGPWYDPGAEPMVYRVNPKLSHVIIKSPRFGLIDPSINAGMGWDEP